MYFLASMQWTAFSILCSPLTLHVWYPTQRTCLSSHFLYAVTYLISSTTLFFTPIGLFLHWLSIRTTSLVELKSQITMLSAFHKSYLCQIASSSSCSNAGRWSKEETANKCSQDSSEHKHSPSRAELVVERPIARKGRRTDVNRDTEASWKGSIKELQQQKVFSPCYV